MLVLYQHDDLFRDFVILGMLYCFQHIYCVPGIQFQKDSKLIHGFRFCEIHFILQVLKFIFKNHWSHYVDYMHAIKQ